jgi:hypothetical protein
MRITDLIVSIVIREPPGTTNMKSNSMCSETLGYANYPEFFVNKKKRPPIGSVRGLETQENPRSATRHQLELVFLVM